MATFLTLNTFLHDIRLFGRIPVYPPAPLVEQRLATMPEALADLGADVVCLQEVFRRPHRDFLAERLRSRYPFSAGLRHPGMPLGTGLMVLSRHPVSEARPAEFSAALFEERLAIRMGLLECAIDLPDLGPCRVINTHLVACGLGRDPQGVRGETCRARQIEELLRRSGASDGRLTIIAGDLNCGPHTSVDNYRQVLAGGFLDIFADAAVGDAISWDPRNPLVQGKNLDLPPQRIDHILLRRVGADRCRPGAARIVLDEPRVAAGTGDAMPVSDHYALLASIDAAG